MKNWKNSEINTPEPPLQGGDYFLPHPPRQISAGDHGESLNWGLRGGSGKILGAPRKRCGTGPPVGLIRPCIQTKENQTVEAYYMSKDEKWLMMCTQT